MAEYELGGRTAIVTGGGRGLGRAMVLALAGAGADVICAAHIEEDFPALEADHGALGASGRLVCIKADIRERTDCDAIIDAASSNFGAADILVNNAGLTFTYIWPDRFRREIPARFWEAEDEIIENVMAVNFVGADRMARRVVGSMVDRGWGRIINVTTMIETMYLQGSSPYGPSKAALEMASYNWLHDLGDTGVSVNILNPGAGADTPGMADEVRRGDVPAIKLIQPEQMMAPIVWLASNASNGVTGMRYDAKPWDASKLAADEAARIGRPLGLRLMER